jgi:copper chaperone CopZ
MKKIVLALLMCLSAGVVSAQISDARLTAAGLTCSMCSKSIYTALKKVKFVASVTPDVEGSSFSIHFRSGVDINPAALRKAVEDAGFSVASLRMDADIRQTDIAAQQVYMSQGSHYNFLPADIDLKPGKRSFRIIDKGFVGAEEEAAMAILRKQSTFPAGGFLVTP